ncbi:MAG: bifunctional tetrahydrofolate synthase/dihydrofolate synthase [Betaproteobacteria bacterium]|nr:bifunctional tetrahydrofolate synthase/dihydrofolate synthase [Betaproteobacteria bacterium]
MTTLDEWLAYLEQLHPKTIDLGLARVAQVAQKLFSGSQQACIITVGGTNGKGSTCAFLESILLQAGYRVGLYTSPHLLRYHERVRVNGVMVDDSQLITAFEAIEAARGDVSLSYFEFGTLAAMQVFRATPLDVWILEVGLGGRLDAVNILDADCAVVTSIDLDHTEYLGDSRELIGREKAGIFRLDRAAVCGDPQPPHSLRRYADEVGAKWLALGQAFTYRFNITDWDYRGTRKIDHLPFPALTGEHQLNNAATALAALDVVAGRLPVDDTAIRQGLMNTQLLGRFQRLEGLPQRILDVAHNPHGATVLAAALRQLPVPGATWAVMAMLADKDIAGVVAAMKGVVDHWLVASLDMPRGAGAEQLRSILIAQGCGDVRIYSSPWDAWYAACELAAENDRIVAFGSFHTIAELLRTENDRVGCVT